MNDILWAPWRMDYILSPKPKGCVFCHAASLKDGSDDENLVVHRGENTYIILNRYPYAHAHLLVVPNCHVDRFECMEPDIVKEFMEMWVFAQRVVIDTFKPQGVNLGMNIGQAAGAGIESHIHAHVVPRWNGDTNFMPLLADTRVMPDHLSETYQKLKSVFANTVIDKACLQNCLSGKK